MKDFMEKRPVCRLLPVCEWVAFTSATFNSSVFPPWPLEALRHGLHSFADFKPSSGEIETKHDSSEKPSQVSMLWWRRGLKMSAG